MSHVAQGSATGGVVVPRLERIVFDDGIRDEWSALAENGGSIFSTWEWSDTWWRHFGTNRELLLHAYRSADGGLLAVLPLYAWRARWPRVIRFLGHGPGDELGPVYPAGASAVGAEALRASLDALDWEVFFGEQLPGDEGWSELLGGRTWRVEASPELQVPAGGWDEYLASRSANFREQLKRRTRDLERAGSIVFRLADGESLESDLDTLFALHRARWRGARTAFSDSQFHREVARRASERGWLRLWMLELDRRPLAAWYGFHVGTVTSYYQAGRDPAYERFSVGLVLLAHTVRAAMHEGTNEYRLGRGAEPFKFRFTESDPQLETVTLARGRTGRAAVETARFARRVRGRGTSVA